MTGNSELCMAQKNIGDRIGREMPKYFDVLNVFDFGKDGCKTVVDYTVKDLVERREKRKWWPLQSSGIGFSCKNYSRCKLETDLVVPYEVEARDIQLFSTIKGCTVSDVHEKFEHEKHIHLNCEVRLGDVENVAKDIVKTHKYLLERYAP